MFEAVIAGMLMGLFSIVIVAVILILGRRIEINILYGSIIFAFMLVTILLYKNKFKRNRRKIEEKYEKNSIYGI